MFVHILVRVFWKFEVILLLFAKRNLNYKVLIVIIHKKKVQQLKYGLCNILEFHQKHKNIEIIAKEKNKSSPGWGKESSIGNQHCSTRK